MNFASDNWADASERVADALRAAAGAPEPAYGGDSLTRAVERRFCEVFEREVAVFFVPTGTAANALALAAFSRPGGVVLCHQSAHIHTDECGAPAFVGGLRTVGLPGDDGRLAPATLREAIAAYPENVVHHGQPAAVSLSQLTEWGAAYPPLKIAALAAVAKESGLGVHMDGARFANAVAATGSTPAELTWRSGIDVLSFGGTKGGCWCAEAVIFFDPALAGDFGYRRKQAGHLISKSRFVAAQFAAYLADGHWLELAAHTNRMAGQLAAGLTGLGARLAGSVDGNEVFVVMPSTMADRLNAAGARFYEWSAAGLVAARHPGPGETLIRLVTSFRTTPDEIDGFLRVAAK